MSNATALAALYQHVVQEELGLVAKIDDEGDVAFRHPELGTLYFCGDDRDPEYLRLVYPSFVDAGDLKLTTQGLREAIDDVNRRSKGVKLYLSQSDDAREPRVSAAVESFVAAPDSMPDEALLRAIVGRCLSVIRHGATQLIKSAEEIRGEAAKQP